MVHSEIIISAWIYIQLNYHLINAGYMGSMMSANGATTSSYGRHSPTASTASPLVREHMKYFLKGYIVRQPHQTCSTFPLLAALVHTDVPRSGNSPQHTHVCLCCMCPHPCTQLPWWQTPFSACTEAYRQIFTH